MHQKLNWLQSQFNLPPNQKETKNRTSRIDQCERYNPVPTLWRQSW